MNGSAGKHEDVCPDTNGPDETADSISRVLEMEHETLENDTGTTAVTSDEDCRVPMDKGWAWFVLLGTLLEMMLIIGILKSAGIIFVAFQERFNSTSSMTSLLSTVQNAVYSLAAPFVLSIGKRITTSRKLLFIGTSLVFVAYVITSQARDMRILLLSHGVLQGLGVAFMQPVAIVTLASYFDKRRGFANSLAVCGGSLGGLILAPLLTYLLKQYGYQGCFLVVSAILLHGFVVGSLFRAHSFYKRKGKKEPTLHDSEGVELESPLIEANQESKKAEHGQALEIRYSNGASETEHKLLFNQDKLNGTPNIGMQQNGTRKRTTNPNHKHQLTHISNSLNKLNGSMNYMCGSMIDLTTETTTEKTLENNSNDKTKTSIKTLLKLLISSFDFKLFRNPIFCVLQLASFIICANTALITVYVSPHAKDMGFSVDNIALLVTVYSATDLVSRLLIAVIADRGWVRRSNITASAVLVIGVTTNCVRFFKTFESLIFYSVVLGMFAGVYFSLFAVLIVDYLTIHKLQAAFGFTSLFHGAGVSLFFFVIGKLRDVTGSYILPFHLMGCLNVIGSLLHFSLPFVERYWKRKEKRAHISSKDGGDM